MDNLSDAAGRPAIFLDRDGVIIENRPDYVRSWDDVAIFPQALRALAAAGRLPRQIVIVTNQSGIGRGLIPQPTAEAINRRLAARIEKAGGRIDGVYVCPHAPEAGCRCRKPRPGLLLQAAAELNIDLTRSIMIGDALTDLQAGLAAGVKTVALVKTGRGRAQLARLAGSEAATSPVYDTLWDALNGLLPELGR